MEEINRFVILARSGRFTVTGCANSSALGQKGAKDRKRDQILHFVI
jgi:hypothetical protein